MMRIRQNRHQAAKKFNRSTARTKRINVARWPLEAGTASSRGVLRATVRNPDAQRETAGPSRLNYTPKPGDIIWVDA